MVFRVGPPISVYCMLFTAPLFPNYIIEVESADPGCVYILYVKRFLWLFYEKNY